MQFILLPLLYYICNLPPCIRNLQNFKGTLVAPRVFACAKKNVVFLKIPRMSISKGLAESAVVAKVRLYLVSRWPVLSQAMYQ